MAAAMVNRFVSSMLNLHAATVTLYNYITLILANIFEQVSLCLLFFVFYAVIHLFRCRIVKADTKTFLVTKYVHWLFVGLFFALVIVDWSWFILCENSLVHDEYAYFTQSEKWAKIDCSRCILFWLAAWEIAGWVCYLGIMASRNLCGARIKMSMYFFIAASGFFLATNFLFFIWDILSYKRFLDNEGYADNGETSSGTSLSATASKGGQAVQEVLRFIFVLGSFFGLALCYWKFPGSESSSEEIEAGIKNRCIDRSGMKPREMDATQPMTTTTKKDKDLSEADYANVVLEADGVNAMNDKQNSTSMIPEIDGSKGIVEADDANVVLEADGIDFIEDKQKLTSKIPGVDNFKGITEADSNTIHKIA
ncbi:hypothetical protein VI817_006794 [Penicillium citrinum]|nr:hypothetical protein VI817_006794 [Penicillium citrinum]